MSGTTDAINLQARLLIIGDSITLAAEEVKYRLVVKRIEPGYVSLLSGALKGVKVLVDAEVGRTTHMASKLLPRLLAKHHPDVVLLFVGGTDADIDWRRFIASRGTLLRNAVPVDQYKRNLLAMSRTIREAGAEPVLTEVPPHCLKRRQARFEQTYGRDLKEVVRRAGGPSESDRIHAAYCSAGAAVAGTYSASFATIAQELSRHSISEVIGEDGQHPNNRGHSVIAKSVFEAVTKSLKRIGWALATGHYTHERKEDGA